MVSPLGWNAYNGTAMVVFRLFLFVLEKTKQACE